MNECQMGDLVAGEGRPSPFEVFDLRFVKECRAGSALK
jgi:hypothetical protein